LYYVLVDDLHARHKVAATTLKQDQLPLIHFFRLMKSVRSLYKYRFLTKKVNFVIYLTSEYNCVVETGDDMTVAAKARLAIRSIRCAV
jgi:hypothetical protein